MLAETRAFEARNDWGAFHLKGCRLLALGPLQLPRLDVRAFQRAGLWLLPLTEFNVSSLALACYDRK